MSMAAIETQTREDKLKWLLRPIDWAWSLSCYVTVFGGALYFEGKIPLEQLCVALLAAIAIIGGLVIWGYGRIAKTARG